MTLINTDNLRSAKDPGKELPAKISPPPYEPLPPGAISKRGDGYVLSVYGWMKSDRVLQIEIPASKTGNITEAEIQVVKPQKDPHKNGVGKRIPVETKLMWPNSSELVASSIAKLPDSVMIGFNKDHSSKDFTCFVYFNEGHKSKRLVAKGDVKLPWMHRSRFWCATCYSLYLVTVPADLTLLPTVFYTTFIWDDPWS